MIKGLEIQVAGRYRLEVSDDNGGYKDYGWFENMVLDSGINSLLDNTNTTQSHIRYISVGSGTTPPTPGDTSLENRIATTGSGGGSYQTGYNAEEGYGWTIRTQQFAQGAAAGNLSEIAAGSNASGSGLFSRALIKNSQGNPIIITVQSHEFLTVTYEVRRWWITPAPYTLTYDDDGTPKTTTVTHAAPDYTTGKKGATAGVTHTRFSLAGLQPSRSAAVNGVLNWERVFGLSEGNPSISSLSTTLAGDGVPEISNFITFDPPIAKTDEYEVTIFGSLTITRRS